MSIKTITTHGYTTETPSKLDVKLGGLLLVIGQNEAKLYTKLLSGKVVLIGEGVSKIADLLDVNLSQAQDGSYLTKQGDTYIATKLLGSISSLTDVEFENSVNGEYARYDDITKSYVNYAPQYKFSDLTDVDVPDSQSSDNSLNDHVVRYNADTNTFTLTARRNNVTELNDVSISEPEYYELLMYDPEADIWTNLPLSIERDPDPKLGANLNAQGNTINNTSYRAKSILADEFTLNLSYSESDYFVVEGLPDNIQSQCIINPTFPDSKVNTTSIMTIELRQDSGNLLIGGLENVIYEDGKPFSLSGEGKTDIISITHVKQQRDGQLSETYNYVNAVALNVAEAGLGGNPSYRYDKNRYPETQVFNPSELYDDFYELVEILLNFEYEKASDKAWHEDKACRIDDVGVVIVPTTTHTINQLSTGKFYYGIEDFVGEFPTEVSAYNWSVGAGDEISLDSDWTLEFFIQYPDTDMYESNSTISHDYFSSPELTVRYSGSIDTSQSTELTVEHNGISLVYLNAFRYFKYQNNRYIHIAVVKNGTTLYTYVDGIYQVPQNLSNATSTSTITISSASLSLRGSVNSLRLTNGIARYTENQVPIPSMRFGLVGGYFNPLETQVHDLMYNISQLDIDPIAEQMFS